MHGRCWALKRQCPKDPHAKPRETELKLDCDEPISLWTAIGSPSRSHHNKHTLAEVCYKISVPKADAQKGVISISTAGDSEKGLAGRCHTPANAKPRFTCLSKLSNASTHLLGCAGRFRGPNAWHGQKGLADFYIYGRRCRKSCAMPHPRKCKTPVHVSKHSGGMKL